MTELIRFLYCSLCMLDINTKASRVRLSGIICTIGQYFANL